MVVDKVIFRSDHVVKEILLSELPKGPLQVVIAKSEKDYEKKRYYVLVANDDWVIDGSTGKIFFNISTKIKEILRALDVENIYAILVDEP